MQNNYKQYCIYLPHIIITGIEAIFLTFLYPFHPLLSPLLLSWEPSTTSPFLHPSQSRWHPHRPREEPLRSGREGARTTTWSMWPEPHETRNDILSHAIRPTTFFRLPSRHFISIRSIHDISSSLNFRSFVTPFLCVPWKTNGEHV